MVYFWIIEKTVHFVICEMTAMGARQFASYEWPHHLLARSYRNWWPTMHRNVWLIFVEICNRLESVRSAIDAYSLANNEHGVT